MNHEQIKDTQKLADSIHENHNKQDLRFIKTEAGIQTAFLTLLQEKDFEEITIQNILDLALINRKTFYNHYLDKYDLLDKMTNEAFEELQGYLKIRDGDALYSDTFLENTNHIYQKLFQNKERFLTLWYLHTDQASINNRLLNAFKDEYASMAKNSPVNSDISFQATIYASLQMGLLRNILESDKPISFEKMKLELQAFSRTIVQSTKLSFID